MDKGAVKIPPINFRGVMFLNEFIEVDLKPWDAFLIKDMQSELYIWTGKLFITLSEFVNLSDEQLSVMQNHEHEEIEMTVDSVSLEKYDLKNVGFKETSELSKDAGIMANDILREYKKEQRQKAMRRMFIFICFIIGLSFGVAMLLHWCLSQVKEGFYTDIHKCSVPFGDGTIEGERSYNYPHKTLFGFRMVDESQITEETKLIVNNKDMTIIGMTNNDWWRLNYDAGDKGYKKLKPADTYVFVGPKDTTVVSYSAFCQ